MRCDNSVLLQKVWLDALGQNVEADFRLRKDLPDCRNMKTDSPVATTDTPFFNKYKKPVNRFECGRKGCITTGTLLMSAADTTVTFRAMYDATDFAEGVITLYVLPDASATLPITLNVALSNTDTFTDADVWTVTLTQDMVTTDGFIPVQVTLATTPTTVEGAGWTPSPTGVYIRLGANQIVGYSSISIYDSLDDFDLLEAVTISCLTTIGGPFDLEVVAQRCQDAKYNDDIQTIPFPVTGTKITSNYMNLFPMLRKGDREIGFKMTNVVRTIGADGKITLPDVNQDVCGYITVQAGDSCAVDTYIHSSSLNVADLDDGHYIVRKNLDGTTDLLFNVSQANTEVVIRYPKTVSITERVANIGNLNSSELSAIIPFPLKGNGGNKEMFLVFDKVFLTSFPMVVTNEENSFAFTLAIGRNDEGDFMRIFEVEE